MQPETSSKGTSLLRAYLAGAIAVACLFSLISIGIWVYATRVLDREETLVSQLLPELDYAYQLASASAGLQSQALLLRSAQSGEELDVYRQALEQNVALARQSIAGLEPSDLMLTAMVDESIGGVTRIAQRLVDIKQQQIASQTQLRTETQRLIAPLASLEKHVQQQVVRLTQELLEDDIAALAPAAAVPEGEDLAVGNEVESRAGNADAINLAIQDYLLVTQDIVSLSALVERVPLLKTRESVSVAEQQRDLLLSTLVSRSIYLTDADNRHSLLLPLRDLRQQLIGDKSLFMLRQEILVQENTQTALGLSLRDQTNVALDQTERLRSQSRATVSMQAQQTLQGLDRYRTFLLFSSMLVILCLTAMSYWLLYRKTVLPLVEITAQLDKVGSNEFPVREQNYFLDEFTRLSRAIHELDGAHKSMLAQDARLHGVNSDLRRANQELEQFAHIASHDLQEPLRKLQQFSDLLEEDYRDKLDDDGQYFIDTIRNAAKRMSTLISETLAYSRAGSKNQTLETVDLSELLLQLKDEMALAIEESDADIRIDSLPLVNANALGMAQLFRNLVLNAIKYCKPDTPAIVTITATELTDTAQRSICIQVADNGVGIDEKYLERIFTPFERMHSGKIQGTGLGLAICRKVCDTHNWSIDVQSAVGVGTSFEIQVPAESVVS